MSPQKMTTKHSVAILALFAVVAGLPRVVGAQETAENVPSLVLPSYEPPTLATWRTTDGHEAKAKFHSIDADAGTVTILVPKTIEIRRLDEASKALILESQKTGDPQFVLRSTIGDPTYAEWKGAKYEQQIALTGELVFAIIRSGFASEMLTDAVNLASDINPLALELYAQIELAVMMAGDDNPSFDPTDLKVTEIAFATAKASGWIDEERLSARDTPIPGQNDTPPAKGGPDTNGDHHVDGVRFSGIRMQPVGDRYRLLGQITNTNDLDIQIGTYYFNTFAGGDLVAVNSLVVTNLRAGESQTFAVDLFDVTGRPDLSAMTITPKAVVSLE